jgi:hypothetical protein
MSNLPCAHITGTKQTSHDDDLTAAAVNISVCMSVCFIQAEHTLFKATMHTGSPLRIKEGSHIFLHKVVITNDIQSAKDSLYCLSSCPLSNRGFSVQTHPSHTDTYGFHGSPFVVEYFVYYTMLMYKLPPFCIKQNF